MTEEIAAVGGGPFIFENMWQAKDATGLPIPI
jgi:hypothetical protein